ALGIKSMKNAAEAQEAATRVKSIIDVAKPYLDAGEEPPVGIHPDIDKIKALQVKDDAKNLDDALKDSTRSATRERAPELFTDYIREINQGQIGVAADAVRKLYGKKEPAPEDGLLGWVSNLVSQLRAAEATGGDVKVPVADWLGEVESEVATGLV